jgi:hypothetical protein
MKVPLVTIGLWALLLLPTPAISASDPIPAGATSGTIQGKIARVESDHIEINSGGSKDNVTIYFDRNTQINGSTPNTIDRVLGTVFGETHDVKVGDQVTATVTRGQQGLIAQSVTTQGPATGSSSPNTSSPPVTSGRVCVRDERASQQGQIVCGELVR